MPLKITKEVAKYLKAGDFVNVGIVIRERSGFLCNLALEII